MQLGGKIFTHLRKYQSFQEFQILSDYARSCLDLLESVDKICLDIQKQIDKSQVSTTLKNKTGTSKVGAISKAQKAQSFLNMPRMYSSKALKTLSRHPKCAFHARYDWKITFPDWKQKKFEIFLEIFLNFF